MRETKSIAELLESNLVVTMIQVKAYHALRTFFFEIIVEGGEELPSEGVEAVAHHKSKEIYPCIGTHEVKKRPLARMS